MLIRRAASLFLILALVVGSTASSMMPRATAAPGMDLAGSAADGEYCRPCAPADRSIAAADCSAICQLPAAVVQPVLALAGGVVPSPWNWNNESGRYWAIEPATAPPRF